VRNGPGTSLTFCAGHISREPLTEYQIQENHPSGAKAQHSLVALSARDPEGTPVVP